MRLILNLTYPHQRVLAADLGNIDIGIVDERRAIRFCCGIIINAFGEDNIVPDVDRYRIHGDDGRIALHSHSQRQVASCSNRHNDVVAEGPQENCDKTIGICLLWFLRRCRAGRPQKNYDRTMVIILESPHKDEYLRNVGQPIAPAQGSTGSNIQRWLDHVLRSCPALFRELSTVTTRVVLSNPVQFQASLASVIGSGSQWGNVRDAVWEVLWNSQPNATSQGCGEQTTNPSYPVRDCFKDRLRTYSPDYIINACTSAEPIMEDMKESVSSFLRRHFPNCKRYEVGHPSSWMNEKSRKLSPLS